jgi:transposase
VITAVPANSRVSACDCLAHRFGNAADRPDRVRQYSSDMTDAEWQVVRHVLPVPAWLEGRGGQPEGYCHRQMLDAIRYVADNAIKWRAMPVDFPAWDRVYAFFRRWRERGLAREFHDRLRGRARQAKGRGAEPTAGVIDSQSVKAAASVPAASRGYDGGKKINGRRRHVITDSSGLLLMVLVTAADVTSTAWEPRPLRRQPFPEHHPISGHAERAQSDQYDRGPCSAGSPAGAGTSFAFSDLLSRFFGPASHTSASL